MSTAEHVIYEFGKSRKSSKSCFIYTKFLIARLRCRLVNSRYSSQCGQEHSTALDELHNDFL